MHISSMIHIHGGNNIPWFGISIVKNRKLANLRTVLNKPKILTDQRIVQFDRKKSGNARNRDAVRVTRIITKS